jgi:hypothetical protein
MRGADIRPDFNWDKQQPTVSFPAGHAIATT